MGRLEHFVLRIATGDRGAGDVQHFLINGFDLDFERVEGGARPGEMLEAEGWPESFPHSLLLPGPESGAWDIARLEITYHFDGESPYTVRLGAVTLEDDADLNLLYPRPAEVIGV